jgi:hypothetical protein
MAAKKAAKAAPQMSAAEVDGVARLITHTARMLMAVEQGKHKSGKSAEERGFTPHIERNKARWSGLSADQRKQAIEYAKGIHDMTPATVKAALAALEG